MSVRAEGLPASSEAMDAAGAVEHVSAFRAALAQGDVERVQALRWLAPRPPGERDLLSDMAAAEGLATAIGRLSRFWRRASVQVERVRVVDAHDVEVYERLFLPSDSLPIVTLVRREAAGRPWKYVCTNEAYDERFVIWLPVAVPDVDDVSLSLALPEDTQILIDGADGVLARGSWLVHVRGPAEPGAWPETLPGQTLQILELATALAPEAAERRAQLRWLLGSARALLLVLGGSAVYLRREARVLMPEAIDAILAGAATAPQAGRFWVTTSDEEGFVYTNGLRLLGLPEIEAERALLGHPDRLRRVLAWLAERVVRAEQTIQPGTEVSVAKRALLVVPGRRGPKRGRSYGRWGAVRLIDAEGATPPGSRSRVHVPEAISND